jgi:CheY-like chemotaxis protein
MSEAQTAAPAQTAVVYFIDDSATMREVIKIAFRKENIQVVTCPSVAAAIEQFGKVRPDVVISDVIMPDRDGYELCAYVKQHAELGATPVILMSGVVNRTVAEKATVVKADELLRKPFQPHELVARVKKLLHLDAPLEAAAGEAAPANSGGASAGGASPANGRAGLGDLFAAPVPAPAAAPAPTAQPAAIAPATPPPAPAPQATPFSAPAGARPAAPQVVR